MNRKAKLIPPLLAVLTLCSCTPTTAEPANGIHIEVTQPARNGAEVARNLEVEGTAELPVGHHLWVFTRRVDFEGFWWPQGEGRLDPTTGTWKVRVTFGGPQDIGWRFDLAVAVFQQPAHAKLREYYNRAMQAEHWPPIEMPETAAPPRLLQVIKVSHLP